MKLFCFKVILLFRIFSQQVLSVRNDEYKCGINRVNGGLVYGGREIIENEYPWKAAIYEVEDDNKRTYICGGVIVSEDTIVTAAHCVSRKRFSKRSLEPSELKVILGEHDLSKKELRTEEVKTIIVHSDWDQNKISFDGDIALIVLKKPVKFNKDLRPVCLPKEDLKSNNLKGTLVGWGLKNDNELSSIARKIILPIMNVGDCIIAERRLSHLYWKESFCAGRKGVGACAGDSGSGFYVEKDGIYYLVGIVSSAVSTMCTESNVALYSDIYSYYRFITQLMKPEFDVIPSYLSKYLHLDLYDEFGAYEYFENGNSLYKKKYYISKNQENWVTAAANCHRDGLQFLTFDTSEEADNFAKSVDNGTYKKSYMNNWNHIGGITKVNGSVYDWRWIESGEKINYQILWGAREPSLPEHEHCLTVGTFETGKFNYHDSFCSTWIVKYFCQIKT